MLYRAYIRSSSKWVTENYIQQEDFYRINVVISWETNEKMHQRSFLMNWERKALILFWHSLQSWCHQRKSVEASTMQLEVNSIQMHWIMDVLIENTLLELSKKVVLCFQNAVRCNNSKQLPYYHRGVHTHLRKVRICNLQGFQMPFLIMSSNKLCCEKCMPLPLYCFQQFILKINWNYILLL